MNECHPDFSPRNCPNCNSVGSTPVFLFSTEKIAALNWSYRPNCAEILGIDGGDEFEIAECNQCGFIYSKLQPSDRMLRLLYDDVIDLSSKYAQDFAKRDCARRLRYLSTLTRLMQPHYSEGSILDYGAGFGQTSMILNSIGSDVIAYDSSAVRIAYLKECGLKVAGSPSEVEQFAPYSAVICDNVLEHVGEPKRLIESFLKNLAPNGILFISVPDCGPKQVAMLRKNPDMSVNPWEHLNYFSLKHLDEMLSSFGFEPLDQIALGERIDLGLRAEYSITRRMKNGLASGMRMIRYMVTGFTVESVSQRFYRLVASN